MSRDVSERYGFVESSKPVVTRDADRTGTRGQARRMK
jgi:hypothetical protein